ncbi:MAG TPA: prepilin-type N-terminal cleavage/methylation domain-containing protein [Gemmatimonadales bacterium]|nr:prepilin-type N-terminal cleavage/methylation domain-containing protein [Gemmatimonadales bacterium]
MRRHNRGFTLIELLIVVVIIGLLATIAIPSFANSKERAYVSRMKEDLRRLATAQEAYIADNAAYYNGAVPNPALMFDPSPGVTITIVNVSPGGWGATAALPGVTSQTCAIFQGTGGPIGPATAEGVVACN